MARRRSGRRRKSTASQRRRNKRNNRKSNRDVLRDLRRPALPKGTRVSKSGKTYREYRDNRTDSHGKVSRKKKLPPKYYSQYRKKGWL